MNLLDWEQMNCPPGLSTRATCHRTTRFNRGETGLLPTSTVKPRA